MRHFEYWVSSYIGFMIHIENKAYLKKLESGVLDDERLSAFKNGVKETQNGVSILNSLFKVRTNTLFGELNNEHNFYFLSGLLIGEELRSLASNRNSRLHLCAGGKLYKLYKTAIEVLELNKTTSIVPEDVVDSSVIRGQSILLNSLK